MEKKYTVLRVIATLYKIAGVLIALGTILIVILVIAGTALGNQAMQQFGFTGGPLLSFFSIIATIIGGGLTALGVYAIGEALYLLIGLEENTRFTAILLRDRFYPQAQPPLPPQQPVAPRPMPQQMPPQQMPYQQMPPQQMPPQHMPPQQMPPQQMPPQQIPPQQMPPQQMPPQQTPPQPPPQPPQNPPPADNPNA